MGEIEDLIESVLGGTQPEAEDPRSDCTENPSAEPGTGTVAIRCPMCGVHHDVDPTRRFLDCPSCGERIAVATILERRGDRPDLTGRRQRNTELAEAASLQTVGTGLLLVLLGLFGGLLAILLVARAGPWDQVSPIAVGVLALSGVLHLVGQFLCLAAPRRLGVRGPLCVSIACGLLGAVCAATFAASILAVFAWFALLIFLFDLAKAVGAESARMSSFHCLAATILLSAFVCLGVAPLSILLLLVTAVLFVRTITQLRDALDLESDRRKGGAS